MNRRAVLWTLGSAAAVLVSAPARRAMACACCADEGARVEGELPLDGFHLGELSRIQFGRSARLFTTDAGMPEDARGIRDASEVYALTLARQADKRGNVWTMTFVDATGTTGRTGNLSWVLPRTMDELAVDTRDGKGRSGVGPTLYRELRLRMPVTGTGVFEPGNAAGTTARLVLQGHGNACLVAEHFTDWMLIVRGPRARYQFFGTLLRPTPVK